MSVTTPQTTPQTTPITRKGKLRINVIGYLQLLVFLLSFGGFVLLVLPDQFYAPTDNKAGLKIQAFLGMTFWTFISFFLMLVHAIKRSSVGWVLAIFFLTPFSLWAYFLIVYIPKSGNYFSPRVKAEDTPDLSDSRP